jgi:hypothetical protein
MKSWFMDGNDPQDYELGIDANEVRNGKNSGYLKSIIAEPKGFGTMMQMFKANDYLNKRMRFSAFMKSEGIEAWAGLWMRIDGPRPQSPLGFDNMENRPIKGTTNWHKYEVVLDVPQESVAIAFGILLTGKGQVWLSEVQFEEVGADVPTTSQEGHGELPDKPGNLDFVEDGA